MICWHKWERKLEFLRTDPIPGNEYFPGYSSRIIATIEYKVCKKCGKKVKKAEDVYTGIGIITR